MRLQEILYSQGFGIRRVCDGLIQQGFVQVIPLGHEGAPLACRDTQSQWEMDGLELIVQGVRWQVHPQAYLMLNKPAGTECSQKPSAHPSIYTLLPAPLRQRPAKGAVQGVQAVGRLDQDTTGLLLLTDDGQFLHRMTSPKHEVPKIYRVTAKHPMQDEQLQRLCEGVVLDDDPLPVRAAQCERVSEHVFDMTLTQGKYHQVKRMIAAVGNRVEQLHRTHIGPIALPEDLAPGQWRWLSASELTALQDAARAAGKSPKK